MRGINVYLRYEGILVLIFIFSLGVTNHRFPHGSRDGVGICRAVVEVGSALVLWGLWLNDLFLGFEMNPR